MYFWLTVLCLATAIMTVGNTMKMMQLRHCCPQLWLRYDWVRGGIPQVVLKCLNRPHFIRGADFADQVSLAACVLHNICERSACPFDTRWFVDIEAVRTAGNATQLHALNPQEQHPAAEQIRSILATIFLREHAHKIHVIFVASAGHASADLSPFPSWI